MAILSWPGTGIGAPLFIINTWYQNTTAANVNLGTPGGGTAVLGTSTDLRPTLATFNSTFLSGNFDGTAPTTQTFQTAFNNWNAAQGANFGGNWKLINGGDLDLAFTVVDTPSATTNNGGIGTFTIAVNKTVDYNGPALNTFVWTQAVYSSYLSKPPYTIDLKTPLITLDTYSNSQGNNGPGLGGAFTSPSVAIPGQTPGANNTSPAIIGATPANSAYSDPIYPFQNGTQGFGDGPLAVWPDESFRAIALLSQVTFKTNDLGVITERDLTVYDGVDWGFDLSVPEPAELMVLIPGFALIVLCRRRGCPAIAACTIFSRES